MSQIEYRHQVVCFGEVLWDIMPEAKLPGGAPMNVAYHLTRLGKNPVVISRVGNDEPGKELSEAFAQMGINTSFFQKDRLWPTGTVYAHTGEHNEMTYDIVTPVAWDFIRWRQRYTPLVQNAEYFVFGSLSTRNRHSKNTLFKCLDAAQTRVLDINLRPPFYSKRTVEELLQKADVLKLNLAELELISGWFKHYEKDEDKLALLKDEFGLKTVIVTKGGDGALLHTGDAFYYHAGYKVKVADTIGSGDSFLAAILSKFMERAPPEEALEFACALGALTASRHGGCPVYTMADIQAVTTAEQNGC